MLRKQAMRTLQQNQVQTARASVYSASIYARMFTQRRARVRVEVVRINNTIRAQHFLQHCISFFVA